jgi:hypothetical protein
VTDVDPAAEKWIYAHASPVGTIEVVHDRPWARVSRVPVAGGAVWFKECGRTQAFEPALTAALASRWPSLVTDVLAHDVGRAWLLLADAGTPVASLGNPPDVWVTVLPSYAELQQSEASRIDEHLSAGVPDLRVGTLPFRYEQLLSGDLPLKRAEVDRLRSIEPRFAELCAELDAGGIPASVQHDDLHMNNLYVDRDTLRVIDWGDASISHPFASLVITFRFLEQVAGLQPGDPWFTRLRDAYLEPWGRGHERTFDLALRVGSFARAFAEARTRSYLPAEALPEYDQDFNVVLRRALAAIQRD